MDWMASGNDGFQTCNIILPQDITNKVIRNTKILGILSIVTSSLSIIGTGSVIVFIIFKRIFKSPDVHPLFHLSIADFLLALFWMIGPIVHFNYYQNGKVGVDFSYFCSAWQGLCEMVHIMSFFLTINYALNVFLRMKEKKDRMFQLDEPSSSQHHILNHDWFRVAVYAFSWVMPVAIIVPLLIELKQGQPDTCQQCIILLDAPRPINDQGNLLRYNGTTLMIVTLAFSITAIVVLYLLTLRMYRKTVLGFHTNRQRVVIHAMATRAAVYIAVFIYCWTPALILASIRVHGSLQQNNVDYPMVSHFGLYVLQTLSAPLQGFLNSLVYGWSRKSFRDAVTRESRQLIVSSNNEDYGTTWDSPSPSLASSGNFGRTI